jgi:hypothetical protein
MRIYYKAFNYELDKIECNSTNNAELLKEGIYIKHDDGEWYYTYLLHNRDYYEIGCFRKDFLDKNDVESIKNLIETKIEVAKAILKSDPASLKRPIYNYYAVTDHLVLFDEVLEAYNKHEKIRAENALINKANKLQEKAEKTKQEAVKTMDLIKNGEKINGEQARLVIDYLNVPIHIRTKGALYNNKYLIGFNDKDVTFKTARSSIGLAKTTCYSFCKLYRQLKEAIENEKS